MSYPHQTGTTTAGITPAGSHYEIFDAYALGIEQGSYRTRVIVPGSRNQTEQLPIVLFLHGVGGTLVNDEPSMLAMWQTWIDQGWIVASPTAGSWGNTAARIGIAAVWQYLTDLWAPPAAGALLYGQSMGGLVGLAVILDGVVPVIAWAGNSPATNLAAAYAHPALDNTIESSYDIAADGSNYATKTATAGGNGGDADPQLREPADFLANCDWYRFYASYGDSTIKRETHSDLMAAKLAAADEAVIVTTVGGHVSGDHYRPADVNAFYGRALAAVPPPPEPVPVGIRLRRDGIEQTFNKLRRDGVDYHAFHFRRDGVTVQHTS